jgi:hypothetical protein
VIQVSFRTISFSGSFEPAKLITSGRPESKSPFFFPAVNYAVMRIEDQVLAHRWFEGQTNSFFPNFGFSLHVLPQQLGGNHSHGQ